MKEEKRSNNWVIVVVVLLVIGFFSIITAGLFSLSTNVPSGPSFGSANVALIPLKGVIVTQDVGTFSGSDMASSGKIIGYIESAKNDRSIDAIVMEINSPGGSPVASDEIAEALLAVDKPTICWIRELGASGGYYVASACDVIVAHEMALTGSIGVIGSYLEFAGLMEDYNVTYRRLVGGKYKDMGSPFKELTYEEERKLQQTIDEIHEIFIREVADNRGMSFEDIEKYATGEVFLGAKAKEIGLVDYVGGKSKVTELLTQKLNSTPNYIPYEEEMSVLDLLTSVMSEQGFQIGQGLAQGMQPETGIRI